MHRLEGGSDIRTVRKLLGHNNVRTTMYSQFENQTQKVVMSLAKQTEKYSLENDFEKHSEPLKKSNGW